MNRALRPLFSAVLAATAGSMACLAKVDAEPCACAMGYVCCPGASSCTPEGQSCSHPSVDASVPPTAPDASGSAADGPDESNHPPPGRGPDVPCSSKCVAKTLASAPKATRLACSPETIYAATPTGDVFAVSLKTPAPVAITSSALGAIGYIAWAAGRLFYTLPEAGEVHARDLATGTDVRLASGQANVQGVAASPTDVFFGTETGIARVSPDVADQTASTRVVFPTVPYLRGASRGIAIAGVRLVVAHAPTTPGGAGALGTYASTGELISYYPFFSETIGVAASTTRTYWSESLGMVSFGPQPVLPSGLQTTAVVTDQLFIGDICFQDGRLYFTAANDTDEREIRYVTVE